jgi:transposase
MKKRKSSHPVFKPYTMGQLQLPSDLEALIPENHLVRVVHTAIEKIDLAPLMRRYKGGGTSSYHPKMMLKVLVYAYTQCIFSSRQIAKALRENIHFMWISGHSRPDFRTINRFRGEVMKGIIQPIFAAVLELLAEEGYVNLERYFLDGTKIEADARRTSWVWAKNTQRYKGRLQQQVAELLEEIERVNAEENEEYGDKDLEELGEEGPIDAEKLERKIEELNERLREDPEQEARLGKALRKIKRDYLPRLKKYEEQERILGERGSYSKTDEDATFMRMKGTAPKAWPRPAYNVQIGTENQFVVGFSIHQRPGDSTCLVPHMKQLKRNLGRHPQKVCADAAYGSEENYSYLEEVGIGAYVKYNTFYQEQRKGSKKKRFLAEQFPYDPRRDEFRCPADKPLRYKRTAPYQTPNGYSTERRVYECEDCGTCSLKPSCTKAKGNRQIRVSFPLREMRARARENLLSEEGVRLRSMRPVEVETVFGRLKHNWRFRRFRLRGLQKVEVEWGLLCISHNLAKLAAT